MQLFVKHLVQADKNLLKQLFSDYAFSSINTKYLNRNFAFVTIPDDESARKAIQALNGTKVNGRKILVKKARQQHHQGKKPGKKHFHNKKNGNEVLPYTFIQRKKPEKEMMSQWHDRLDNDHFDIAFEINWTTLTATALNPCRDEREGSPFSNQTKDEYQRKNEYQGYDKRWLMVQGNRPAISPFTVKSAIANGFANIMGSCYRGNTSIIGHPENVKKGTYYQGGKFKRYRVDKSDSQPGILAADVIHGVSDPGKSTIKIERIQKECLYLGDSTFIKGSTYYAQVKDRGKHFGTISKCPREASGRKKPEEVEVIYYGRYRFGMNLELKQGDLGKKYRHRFYQKQIPPFPTNITADIHSLHFQSSKKMKENVYMGNFQPLNGDDPRDSRKIKIWFDDLSQLKKGDWVYYHQFKKNGNVDSIGRNFLFKALFAHEDTIPKGFETCNDLACLCPRCRLFGMTVDESSFSGRKADTPKALKGRFKSDVLIHDNGLKEKILTERVPKEEKKDRNANQKTEFKLVKMKQWFSQGKEDPVFCQFLMPLLAEPKNNKRGKGGRYYDPDTGEMKGAKVYLTDKNSAKDLNTLKNRIKTIDKKSKKYAHKQRNFAVACDKGLTFTGVVGIKNADKDEIAALLCLLEKQLGNHRFKVGLGKSLGMGLMDSSISAVWIRDNTTYQWEHHRITPPGEKKTETGNDALTQLMERLGIQRKVQALGKISAMIQQSLALADNERIVDPLPRVFSTFKEIVVVDDLM